MHVLFAKLAKEVAVLNYLLATAAGKHSYFPGPGATEELHSSSRWLVPILNDERSTSIGDPSRNKALRDYTSLESAQVTLSFAGLNKSPATSAFHRPGWRRTVYHAF